MLKLAYRNLKRFIVSMDTMIGKVYYVRLAFSNETIRYYMVFEDNHEFFNSMMSHGGEKWLYKNEKDAAVAIEDLKFVLSDESINELITKFSSLDTRLSKLENFVKVGWYSPSSLLTTWEVTLLRNQFHVLSNIDNAHALQDAIDSIKIEPINIISEIVIPD